MKGTVPPLLMDTEPVNSSPTVAPLAAATPVRVMDSVEPAVTAQAAVRATLCVVPPSLMVMVFTVALSLPVLESEMYAPPAGAPTTHVVPIFCRVGYCGCQVG